MSTEINRILFATDLSRNSYHAFKYAVALAKMSGAEIHELHVVEPLSDDAKITLTIFMQDEQEREKALSSRVEPVKAEFKKRIDQFWDEMPQEDQVVRKQVVAAEVVEGHVADQILSNAESKNCDIIVLGAHQHGISHTFLGSTAKRVMRRARVPTLIVPYKDDD